MSSWIYKHGLFHSKIAVHPQLSSNTIRSIFITRELNLIFFRNRIIKQTIHHQRAFRQVYHIGHLHSPLPARRLWTRLYVYLKRRLILHSRRELYSGSSPRRVFTPLPSRVVWSHVHVHRSRRQHKRGCFVVELFRRNKPSCTDYLDGRSDPSVV